MPTIFDAIRNNDIYKIKQFIEENPDILASKNESGFCPIVYAAYQENWTAVTAIADSKASPLNDPYDYSSALYWAIQSNQNEVAQFLLNQGATQSRYDALYLSNTLDLAVKNKNASLVRLLIKHHGFTNFNYKTLENICRNNFNVDILLAFENCEVLDLSNKPIFETALFGAIASYRSVRSHDEKIVSLFIKKGVNPHCKNENGQTPFEFALEKKAYTCLKPLTVPKDKIDTTTHAECIHHLLEINAVTAETVPELILFLSSNNNRVLKDMLLVAQKNLADDESDANLPVWEKEKLKSIINSFLNYPDYSPSTDELALLFKHCEKVNLVLKYIQILIDIRNYCETIRDMLLDEKSKLVHPDSNLKRKWWGIPLYGLPKHVDYIKTQLEKLTPETPRSIVLEIYLDVIHTLYNLAPSTDRQPGTIEFDDNLKKKIRQRSFIPLSNMGSILLPQTNSLAASNEANAIPATPIPSAPMQTRNESENFVQVNYNSPPPSYEEHMHNTQPSVAREYPLCPRLYPDLPQTDGDNYYQAPVVYYSETQASRSQNFFAQATNAGPAAAIASAPTTTNKTIISSTPFAETQYPAKDTSVEVNEALNTPQPVKQSQAVLATEVKKNLTMEEYNNLFPPLPPRTSQAGLYKQEKKPEPVSPQRRAAAALIGR